MSGLLENLTNIPAPSGNEQRLTKFIAKTLKNHVDELYTDSIGNLYAHKKGSSHTKVMFDAHMDEVGMIVTGFTRDGKLNYESVGIDERITAFKPVVIGPNSIHGIITPSKKIDIAALSQSDAERVVSIGDYISFDTKFQTLSDPRYVTSKALDNRIGCYVLINLLKENYNAEVDLYGVFSVQEENGLRGVEAAVFNLRPDIAFVLEATMAQDLSSIDETNYVTILGQGPALSFMDSRTIFDKKVLESIIRCANDAHIKFQIRKTSGGGNDAGPIHTAIGGCPVGAISVPCRYIHAPNSVANLNDIETTISLLKTYLKDKRYEEALNDVRAIN
jgi:endoglucanase